MHLPRSVAFAPPEVAAIVRRDDAKSAGSGAGRCAIARHASSCAAVGRGLTRTADDFARSRRLTAHGRISGAGAAATVTRTGARCPIGEATGGAFRTTVVGDARATAAIRVARARRAHLKARPRARGARSADARAAATRERTLAASFAALQAHRGRERGADASRRVADPRAALRVAHAGSGERSARGAAAREVLGIA